jgi:hypothetical protein
VRDKGLKCYLKSVKSRSTLFLVKKTQSIMQGQSLDYRSMNIIILDESEPFLAMIFCILYPL